MRDSFEILSGLEASVAAGAPSLAGRRFLLVTLPAGPFGRELGTALRALGAETLRVVFNGGDLLDWGFHDVVLAQGPFEDWTTFVERTLVDRSITDLVVFGDATPYSAGAVAAPRRAGTRLWVIENGYQRPHWVTVEPDGVNANSALPRDPRAYDDVDLSSLGEDPPPVGQITPFHVMHTFNYFAGVILAWPMFRRYRYPYAVRIWPQAFGHLRRYLVWLLRRRAFEREALAVLDDPGPFFLACLQRDGDSQLLAHSELKTNRAFMTNVIRSFAADAPADARLVIKNHPLDPGVEDLGGLCRDLTWSYGVSERVRFLDGGAFAPLAHGARGLIAVNSTAALAALEFGTPVKLLGRALFDIAGLTDSQSLSDFWKAPKAPDAMLLARFRRRLVLRTQVYGSFHNPSVRRRTARGVAARLLCPNREFLA